MHTRKSLQKTGKSVLKRLEKVTVPNEVQKILSANLCQNMYVLIHRQMGKTHFIRQTCLDFLEAEFFPNYTPSIGIFASKLKQTLKLYRSKMHTLLEEKDYKLHYSHEEGSTLYRRHDGKLSRVDYYGANFDPDTDRGGTYPFIPIDEYGAFKPNFAKSVVAPMGDVLDAPMFITGTPLGPNHFKKEFDYAKRKMESGDRDFFAFKWNLQDSVKAGLRTQEQYDKIEKRYPPDQRHVFEAEYLLNWFSYVPDQIFSIEISDVYETGRVGYYPHLPGVPVDTFWDIGTNGTAVWFRQSFAGFHRYFYYRDESFKVNMQKFIMTHVLPYRNMYNFRYHVFPSDIIEKDYTSEKNRLEIAQKLLGFDKVRKGPSFRKPLNLIESVRRTFSRCQFHAEETQKGVDRLSLYKMKGSKPDKDVESHGADAFILSEVISDYMDFSDVNIDRYSIRGDKYESTVKSPKSWWY